MELDDIAIQTIISSAIDNELNCIQLLGLNINKTDVLTDFEPYIKRLNNARLAKNLVKEYFSKKSYRE